ncbi:alkaline phosphatase family protein [Olivibacter ginsenosidimutans]|uniref:Alkaline phosphatase family protein n=1 Tax=Olivibacter ginsenosidimutans TaxID=1176537 RepID=A0ABP9ASH2_9SPHI
MDWSTIFKTFAYGLRMDASMAAYICALPALTVATQLWLKRPIIPKRAAQVYVWVVIGISSLITIINLNIYREWDTLFSYKAIDIFLDAPQLAFASASSSPIWLSLSLLVMLIVIGLLLAKGLGIYTFAWPVTAAWPIKAITSFGVLVIVFLFIRGGWGLTPLNSSMVYFTTEAFPNHAATNVVWYLMNDVVHAKGQATNPYRVMDDRRTTEILKPLLTTEGKSPRILTNDRPNIVFILLESFTADLIEALGGEKGVAPRFEQLIKEGILFDQIYASGDRTDKGIIAALSAFPSQSSQSIIKSIHKQEGLPSLVKDFAQKGYHTSFYYGGESEFYNFKGYMLSHACDRVVDQYSFAAREVKSKWGVFDELTFNRQLQDLSKEKEPFFSTILSLNNHEPFDLPGAHKFGKDNLPDLFRSTAYYTDSVLYDYLHRAKAMPWYKHTLFVIVADHGHRLPLEKWDSNHPKRYHIPLLFYGDVIGTAYRGKRIDQLGSQVDIASTLCHQAGLSSDAYVWSRDLLNPTTKPFAFFTWANGWGVVDTACALGFDNVGKVLTYTSGEQACDEKSPLFKSGQAYMQAVYQQYLTY